MSTLNRIGDLKFSLILAACAFAAPTLASAQSMKEDVQDVAETPLEDVGINKKEISEVLLAAAENPYAIEGIDTCNGLVGEIAKLDNVLGDDYDVAGKEGTGINAKKVAKGVVGSFIPFRSLVREVSGAAGDARKAAAAVRAGIARRSYLKGLGQGMDCKYPARPRGS